jgi:hypothetical protein
LELLVGNDIDLTDADKKTFDKAIAEIERGFKALELINRSVTK